LSLNFRNVEVFGEGAFPGMGMLSSAPLRSFLHSLSFAALFLRIELLLLELMKRFFKRDIVVFWNILNIFNGTCFLLSSFHFNIKRSFRDCRPLVVSWGEGRSKRV